MPWNLMRGMRDILVEYFGVSPDGIWRTIEEDLPPMVPLLQRMLQSARD
jgi:uncharacterized protein with HEPN domain